MSLSMEIAFETPHYDVVVFYPVIKLVNVIVNKETIIKTICDSESEFEKMLLLCVDFLGVEKDHCMRVAIIDGHFEIVKQLVERGVDIFAEPLFVNLAAQYGRLDVFKYFISCGIKIAPVHLAFAKENRLKQNQHTDLMEYLREGLKK